MSTHCPHLVMLITEQDTPDPKHGGTRTTKTVVAFAAEPSQTVAEDALLPLLHQALQTCAHEWAFL